MIIKLLVIILGTLLIATNIYCQEYVENSLLEHCSDIGFLYKNKMADERKLFMDTIFGKHVCLGDTIIYLESYNDIMSYSCIRYLLVDKHVYCQKIHQDNCRVLCLDDCCTFSNRINRVNEYEYSDWFDYAITKFLYGKIDDIVIKGSTPTHSGSYVTYFIVAYRIDNSWFFKRYQWYAYKLGTR